MVDILLITILLLVFILPFIFRKIEHNLELFLLVMGIIATVVSKTLSLHLLKDVFSNYLLYLVTAVVLVMGFVFNLTVSKFISVINSILGKIRIEIFVSIVILVLGLISSIITAIVATLILVEIIHLLPLKHKTKVKIAVIGCFSIGFGAALTPVGEPLSTIVVSSLNASFLYLFEILGVYIIPTIVILSLLSYFILLYERKRGYILVPVEELLTEEEAILKAEERAILELEARKDVAVRAGKIFMFIIALELLGNGFKPFIDKYVVNLGDKLLFWINVISAALDNATVAAAEITPGLAESQVKAILLSLLASGGILIQGNIPNIIASSKLEIKSKEWVRLGLPLGVILLFVFYLILFVV
ncbi:DUF1646 family protein [Caldicellulosiruptor morganii]|uniref:DUF1646 domain-containing protein n=1 Tax=Caldicellulosiruptor morganii TaxID=1387555 RepID=A0ABY7BMF7_9FIRM|nr:DUF1646 family protein [Caldicellulosiruptor morganii]WAM34038.1 DUF1646 domain-containing protein [Caldicellulosiruptor morganii]